MIGLDYNDRVSNEMQNMPLSFSHINNNDPWYYMPLHWHYPFEIVRIISGNLKIHINDQEITAGENDIIFINQESIHGYTPLNCVYEVINFSGDQILLHTSICKDALRIFTNGNANVSPLIAAEKKEIYFIINKLFDIASSNSEKNELLLWGILIELLGIIYQNHYFIEKHKPTANIELFKPLLKYIEESYMKPITLTEMALLSNISTSHFSLLFREYFHQTPVDYLNSYRIEQSCLYLTNSSLSITEIAQLCGFSDSAYFVKVFKKYKKITPKKYRTTDNPKPAHPS